MVEHRLYTPGVTGSSPVPPTINLVFPDKRRDDLSGGLTRSIPA